MGLEFEGVALRGDCIAVDVKLGALKSCAMLPLALALSHGGAMHDELRGLADQMKCIASLPAGGHLLMCGAPCPTHAGAFINSLDYDEKELTCTLDDSEHAWPELAFEQVGDKAVRL